MWQWPRVIMMMMIIIKNHSNKLLSTLQRAFSSSPGNHTVVREGEMDGNYSHLADEGHEAMSK